MFQIDSVCLKVSRLKETELPQDKWKEEGVWWKIYFSPAVVKVGTITVVKVGSWGRKSWKLHCLHFNSEF